MSDYDHYLDLQSIKSGDKFFARRQYHLSEILYQQALNKLLAYPGDRMFPMHLVESLRNKLDQTRSLMAGNR